METDLITVDEISDHMNPICGLTGPLNLQISLVVRKLGFTDESKSPQAAGGGNGFALITWSNHRVMKLFFRIHVFSTGGEMGAWM